MIDFAAMGIIVNLRGLAEKRAACPQCAVGQRDTALGVNIETGAYHCFRCGWSGRAGVGNNAIFSPISRIDDPVIAERKRERLRKTWRETISLAAPKARPVRRYLSARALGDVLLSPPAVLRAHPALPYWDGNKNLGAFPAMVALFNSADGTPTTLHITWLRADGTAKACVPSPKKIMGVPRPGATKGGSIRLYGPRDGILGVAEGIESALSLHVLQRIPTWASFCADNLVRIVLPLGIHTLFIGVDIDKSGKGEAAAQMLARRISRRSRKPHIVFIRPNGAAPSDLNDELRRRRTP